MSTDIENWRYGINYKKFEDLPWCGTESRNEALNYFVNGYGVLIYYDVKWHDGQWR
ncbi:MAG: hypothetical protein H0V61_00635 [Chitinophagales bacterium]|nr:hypothetical protein [Chitinophagales bacterium]